MLSYALSTSYYNMFLFINDTLNTNLAVFINNGTLTAQCNGGAMTVSNGYFTSTNCTTALTINNTVTGAIIYTAATFTPTIIFTVCMNRFVMPAIWFTRSKIITSESAVTI